MKTTPPASEPDAPSNTEAPKRFRRLQANELVRRGDFVADGRQAFELWEGLTGFRADAFVKAIYRMDEKGSFATSELAALNEQETEPLERIRNPAKYLGK
jgi:hypothetical protein